MTDEIIYAWREESGDVWTGEWALDRSDKWVPAEANKYILDTPEVLAKSDTVRALVKALALEQAVASVRDVWGRCEALEDEAADKLARSDELTDHERGFWRSQKSVAKSIRRSTEMPLATLDGLAWLAELRAERDGWENNANTVLSRLTEVLSLLTETEAERDDLRARLAEAEGRVKALTETYWLLRSYAIHDDKCKLNKPPHFKGPCSCGLSEAIAGGVAALSPAGEAAVRLEGRRHTGVC